MVQVRKIHFKVSEEGGQSKETAEVNLDQNHIKSYISNRNSEALSSDLIDEMSESILLESQSTSKLNGKSTHNGTDSTSQDDIRTSGFDRIDELPEVSVGNIPLSHIIDRANTHAYTELLNLVETLPSKINEEKKKLALDYTFKMRQAFVKLIAITRWAKNSEEIYKAQRIVAYLQSQNEYFTKAVDGIFGSSLLLSQSRIRNYDVPGAINVFTTGSHDFLPQDYLKRFVVPPPLSLSEKLSAIGNIEDEIRYRLATGEPLPDSMKIYKIEGGRITFTVKSEYEISLTILQFSRRVPWHVVSLKVLVGSSSLLSRDLKFEVSDTQKQKLLNLCQNILVDAELDYSGSTSDLTETSSGINEASTSDLQTETKSPIDPEVPPTKDNARIIPPLAQLNDFLLDMSFDRTAVTLRYWISKNAASTAPKLTFSNMDSVLSPDKKHDQSYSKIIGVSGENFLRIRLLELDKPRPINSSSSSDSPIFPKHFLSESDSENDEITKRLYENEFRRGQLATKHCLQLEWMGSSGLFEKNHEFSSKYGDDSFPSMNKSTSNTNISSMFNFYINSISAESILKFIEIHHSRLIINGLCSSVSQSGVLSPSDIQLIPESQIDSFHDNNLDYNDDTSILNEPIILRLWYRSNESAVDISVDTTTGRLLVKSSTANKSCSNSVINLEILQKITISLNQSPWRLTELLIELRSMLTMSDIEYLAINTHGVEPLRFDRKSSIVKINSSSSIPLKISQSDNDKILKQVLNYVDQSQLLIQVLRLDFTNSGIYSSRFEWYILVSMKDTMEFHMLQLRINPKSPFNELDLQFIYPLKVDSLFETITKNSLMLDLDSALSRDSISSDVMSVLSHKSVESNFMPADNSLKAKDIKNAIIKGRSLIPHSYLEGLISTCFAYISTYFVQSQLLKTNVNSSFTCNSDSSGSFSNIRNFYEIAKSEFFPNQQKKLNSNVLSDALQNVQSIFRFNNSNSISLFLSTNSLHNCSKIDWLSICGDLPLYSQNKAIKLTISPITNPLGNSGRNPLKSSTFYRSNRYCVIVEFPLSLLGLPNSILNSREEISQSLEVDFKSLNIKSSKYSSHSSLISNHPSFLVKKVYYNLETAVYDFIADWSNITLISHIIFITPKHLIQEFKVGENRPFQHSGSIRRAIDPVSPESYGCSDCGIPNLFSPLLVIKTDISGVFVSISFKPSDLYEPSTTKSDENPHFNDYLPQKSSFSVSLVRTNPFFDNSLICGHKWNYIPIVCSNCDLLQRCYNCIKFSKYLMKDSWKVKKLPWMLIRSWVNSFKLNLDRFCKIQPVLSRLKGMEFLLSILGGVDSYTSPLCTSLIGYTSDYHNCSSSEYGSNSQNVSYINDTGALEYKKFSQSVLYLFQKPNRFVPKTLVVTSDTNVRLVLCYHHSFIIQRYSPGMYTVRGDFMLTDSISHDNSNSCTNTFLEKDFPPITLLFKSLVEKFIISQDIYLSENFHTTSLPLQSDPFQHHPSLKNNPDSENHILIPLASDNSHLKSMDQISLQFYRAMKVINVHENAFICNNEFLAIFLKHACQLIGLLDVGINGLAGYVKEELTAVEGSISELLKFETENTENSFSITNINNSIGFKIYPKVSVKNSSFTSASSHSVDHDTLNPRPNEVSVSGTNSDIVDGSFLKNSESINPVESSSILKITTINSDPFKDLSVDSFLDIYYHVSLFSDPQITDISGFNGLDIIPEDDRLAANNLLSKYMNSVTGFDNISVKLVISLLFNIITLPNQTMLLFLKFIISGNLWPYLENGNRIISQSNFFNIRNLENNDDPSQNLNSNPMEVRILPFIPYIDSQNMSCDFKYDPESQLLQFVLLFIEVVSPLTDSEFIQKDNLDLLKCILLPIECSLNSKRLFRLNSDRFQSSHIFRFSYNLSQITYILSSRAGAYSTEADSDKGSSFNKQPLSLDKINGIINKTVKQVVPDITIMPSHLSDESDGLGISSMMDIDDHQPNIDPKVLSSEDISKIIHGLTTHPFSEFF
ncbi:Mediator of RNA polymerase II transcription subunit 14 [Smittium mucronatum]|uniref:Mediator of RNA polymerase II transcription subunit 14 n=1 Tax=Smittium mucronatum TaxID=133383 RepID=A0A1R0GY47_9FUNG|nr:Mediator of RNA polymerase II transcription subunit 14 [Smittium mucronatum]